MAKHIVRGTLTDRNELEQAMLDCYRQLGSGMQNDLLHIATLHLKHLTEMMQETGLDRDTSSAGYSEWITGKAREALYARE